MKLSGFSKRWQHVLLVAVMVAAGCLLGRASRAEACSYEGEPWFTETVRVESDDIPGDIRVRVDGDNNILVHNPHDKTITVLDERGAPIEISKDVTQGSDIKIYRNHFSQTLIRFEDARRFGAGRPEEVRLPSARSAVLKLRVGGQTAAIQLEFHYSLNQSYDPEPGVTFMATCTAEMAALPQIVAEQKREAATARSQRFENIGYFVVALIGLLGLGFIVKDKFAR